MEFFRNMAKTKASRVFLTLLALSFVAWGVGGYLGAVTGVYAISVGDEQISTTRLDENYRNRVAAMTQALGRAPTAEELEQSQMAEQVVNEAIARAALRQAASQLGLVAAMKSLQDEIAGNPVFHGDNGTFDAARYKAILAQAGRTPEQFEKEMSADMGVKLLGNLVKPGVVGAESAWAPQVALDNAALELEVVRIDAGRGVIATPSEDDLHKHYELNQRLYASPEKRSFSMMEISAHAVSGSIAVPEERVKAEYEGNKASYTLPEQRVVRHILVESEEKATSLAREIKSKADFERVANVESKDPGNAGNGGLLGNIGKDAVVPEFGEEAFSIAPNTLSKPVKTAYGWHLIWVDEVQTPRSRTYAEVAPEIREQLVASELQDAVSNVAAKADEMVLDGKSLKQIGAALGLKVVDYTLVEAGSGQVPAAFSDAAFATEEGEISVPLALTDGGSAYVQVTKVSEAAIPALADVKDKVVKDWQAVQQGLAMQRDANKVLENVRKVTTRSVADAVAQSGVAGAVIEHVTLTDLKDAPSWIHRHLLEIFQLPEGGTLASVAGGTEAAYVVRLNKRSVAKPDDKMLAEGSKVYAERLRNDLEQLMIVSLQAEARVKCNQVRLRQVFGRDIVCPE